MYGFYNWGKGSKCHLGNLCENEVSKSILEIEHPKRPQEQALASPPPNWQYNDWFPKLSYLHLSTYQADTSAVGGDGDSWYL